MVLGNNAVGTVNGSHKDLRWGSAQFVQVTARRPVWLELGGAGGLGGGRYGDGAGSSRYDHREVIGEIL